VTPASAAERPLDQPVVLTVQQASALLQISENHLYSLIAQDAVPHVRFGKLIRIPRWGLLQYIASSSRAPLVDASDVASLPTKSVHVQQPAKEGD
jgi:excisionase family DNA binding protein